VAIIIRIEGTIQFACEIVNDAQSGGWSRSARGLKPYTSENRHGTSLPASRSGARMLPPPEGK
jgi:hypothetical protein